MSKPLFTQDSVNTYIAEVKVLPEQERRQISDQVKADLRGWLLQTFEFTPAQVTCMDKWPLSMREETGFGIGTALLYEEWNLVIIFPNQPENPPVGAKKKHEQSVSGSYNTQTGGYTVTKTHKWSW